MFRLIMNTVARIVGEQKLNIEFMYGPKNAIQKFTRFDFI
jgi:hypothetical protein